MTNQILAIDLACGYAEDSTVSSMWFEAGAKFDTIERTLGFLGAEFFRAYFDIYLNKAVDLKKDCCKKSFEKKDAFCSKCGKKLTRKSLDEDSIDDFEIFIKSTCLHICDGTGFLHDFRLWEESGAHRVLIDREIKTDNILFITQNGEKFLCYFLGQLLKEKESRDEVLECFENIFDEETIKTFVDYETEYGLHTLEGFIRELKEDNKHLEVVNENNQP